MTFRVKCLLRGFVDMVNSPKERLQKLFHRHDTKKDEAANSPPASPSTAGVRGHVRKISSRASLRDALHSRGTLSRFPTQS